ncbi:MAG: hypothetical protein GDA67_12755 [Nitrospira sp. CR1.3]|nr:hypothetical protein [Nitrospira sp. CR1.3]
MNEVELRIPWGIGQTLKNAIVVPGRYEPIVFGLVSHTRIPDKHLLLLRKLIIPPPDAYLPSTGHGAKWKGSFTIEVLNVALRERLGVLLFHAHDHRGKVSLSPDDEQSARALLPRFQVVMPGRPHASVVIGRDHAACLLALPEEEPLMHALRVRWLGPHTIDWVGDYRSSSKPTTSRIHDRQILAIRGPGQVLLQRTKVAVVGLGGGGSLVVKLLARMGVGEIIGIDPDVADQTNRGRMAGLWWIDVFLKRKKTKVMARLAWLINRSVRFTEVPYAIPEQNALDAAKRADIIVGCVDSLHARSDLQAISWRYLIPYIDIGARIQLEPVPEDKQEPRVRAIGGNVQTLIPGGFCMWCADFLSQEKLDAETGRRSRSYFDKGAAQAQVVSFNALLAGQAASEVLQLVTGFSLNDDRPLFKKYNGFDGTLEGWKVLKNPLCTFCQNELSAGDALWLSETSQLNEGGTDGKERSHHASQG